MNPASIYEGLGGMDGVGVGGGKEIANRHLIAYDKIFAQSINFNRSF